MAQRLRRGLRRSRGNRGGNLVQARHGGRLLLADQSIRRDVNRSSRGRLLPVVGSRTRGPLRDAGTPPVPPRHGVVDRISSNLRAVSGPAETRWPVEVHRPEDDGARAGRRVLVFGGADANGHTPRSGVAHPRRLVFHLHPYPLYRRGRFRAGMGIVDWDADDRGRHPADLHRHGR